MDVLNDVGFSAAYWRELGGRLKPCLDMDAIEADHGNVKRRLEDVVEKWQRDGDSPSWETLAEAVALCKVGGGKNLAQKIRQRAGLGEAVRMLECHTSYFFFLFVGHTRQKSADTAVFSPNARKR